MAEKSGLGTQRPTCPIYWSISDIRSRMSDSHAATALLMTGFKRDEVILTGIHCRLAGSLDCDRILVDLNKSRVPIRTKLLRMNGCGSLTGNDKIGRERRRQDASGRKAPHEAPFLRNEGNPESPSVDGTSRAGPGIVHVILIWSMRYDNP